MKTQKISRKDLQVIYSKVCNDWQKAIAELVLSQDGSTIDVDNNLIYDAYQKANTEQKKMLEKHFKIISNDVKDKIRNLEEVYDYLGIDRDDVIPFKKPRTKLQRAANAFVDINHISLALNESWTPDFTNSSQYKYYPYFERKSHGWVVRSYRYGYGVGCVGSGRYYKTSDLALYAADTFLDVYKDLLPE